MDLMSLKYFQFVAMYRNFSRAAEHFYIGQSALSRQIANLEKELGVQLFNRDTRNVNLTAAGSVLYDNCDLLLRHHELVGRLIEAAKSGYDGQLSIATVANFGPMFTDLVKKFIATYPNVKIRIDDIPFGELSDSIINGVYDLAFTFDYAVPHNDQVAKMPVGDDHFVAVMSADFPTTVGETATTRDLLELPVIIPRHIDPPFLRQFRLAGQESGAPSAGRIEYVPNTLTAMLQVDMGLGITFLPKAILGTLHGSDRYRCCELSDMDTSCSLLLIRRKDNVQKTVQNFVDLARDNRRVRRAPR
ncbi:MAG: LysR family transcriptional regulator [Cellulomonadaceae bacterium]|nr:LysR family transcriptional regulator [Cellulomonadaceae bacterium]